MVAPGKRVLERNPELIPKTKSTLKGWRNKSAFPIFLRRISDRKARSHVAEQHLPVTVGLQSTEKRGTQSVRVASSTF